MLLRALCGIAGIFAGSIAIWVILSNIQGPLPIGVPFLAFGIAFPVMMAYLALPDCRWWGKRPRKRNVRFFALAAPTLIAVVGIAAERRNPSLGRSCLGNSGGLGP